MARPARVCLPSTRSMEERSRQHIGGHELPVGKLHLHEWRECTLNPESPSKVEVTQFSKSLRGSTLSNQASCTRASKRHTVLYVTSQVDLSGPGGGGSGRKPMAADPRPGAARLTRRSGRGGV
ncbi:hypothetical protein E2C01_010724 [Portunus trituberculatus]|uniref:Uncharacterized protein n=1 Tax=Portunus trituberculatus TaxID=210409 RepID=A0A5B7D9F2_PORTR|nr:hypothetical protein [Portunus trituberculatus]